MYLNSCMDSDSADVADLGTLVKSKGLESPMLHLEGAMDCA